MAMPDDVVAHKQMTNALNDYWPGAQWALSGSSYDDLLWLDETVAKPTEQELADAMANPKPPEAGTESTLLYEHENRLRALEGSPPLSVGEFLAKAKGG